jgi:N-acetyl-anhydromuramyl-L-alanine amidase AmpD
MWRLAKIYELSDTACFSWLFWASGGSETDSVPVAELRQEVERGYDEDPEMTWRKRTAKLTRALGRWYQESDYNGVPDDTRDAVRLALEKLEAKNV